MQATIILATIKVNFFVERHLLIFFSKEKITVFNNQLKRKPNLSFLPILFLT